MFAKEYAIKKIRVNAIAPGTYRSEMTDFLIENNKQAHENFIQSTPMKREGSIEEVFSAIRYLCSDDATYVTGTVIAVDGGLSTHSM
ncbi:hypothetical protein ABK040_001769 [Willaertia magna]